MAYTLEQYNALKSAIADGVLEVSYSDKTVKYRSLNDMLRIQKLMESELGISKPNGGRRYAAFNSGLNTSDSDE